MKIQCPIAMESGLIKLKVKTGILNFNLNIRYG